MGMTRREAEAVLENYFGEDQVRHLVWREDPVTKEKVIGKLEELAREKSWFAAMQSYMTKAKSTPSGADASGQS